MVAQACDKRGAVTEQGGAAEAGGVTTRPRCATVASTVTTALHECIVSFVRPCFDPVATSDRAPPAAHAPVTPARARTRAATPALAMAAARLAPAARALIVLSLFASSSAWLGSTLAVTGSGSAIRSPVLVFAPNSATSAKLPLVLLLHGRCENALSADSNFHFANNVDQARAPLPARAASRTARGAVACICSKRDASKVRLTRRSATVRLRARSARGHPQQRQRVRRMQLRAAGPGHELHLPSVGRDACVLQQQDLR